MDAKPNRRADEGGNDLAQAASPGQGESQSSVISLEPAGAAD